MAKPHAAPRAHTAAEPWLQWTEPAGEPGRADRPRRAAGAEAPARAAGARRSRPAPAGGRERRRRAQHFARRRRDLLVDAVLALVLALVLISLTAGLGILLLVVLPMAAGLVGHRIVQRRRARRERGTARSAHPRRRPGRGSRAGRPRGARG